MQSKHFTLSTLSPVHIGNGEELVPGFYLISEGWLYQFNEMQLIEALSPAMSSELNALLLNITQGSLLDLQRFFDRHQQQLIPFAVSAFKVLPGVEEQYRKRLEVTGAKRNGAINRQTILQLAHNPVSGNAYIPGSSIKGAIRTAILQTLEPNLLSRAVQRGRKGLELLETRLLEFKNATDDPFKRLRVSDASNETQLPASISIMKAVNISKDASKAVNGKGGVSQDVCALLPMQHRCLSGSLRLSSVPDLEEKSLPQHDLDSIITACNIRSFHQIKSDITLLEQHSAAQHSPFNVKQNWLNSLKQQLDGGELAKRLLENQAMLLKLGRYTGGESKTLPTIRKIKNHKSKELMVTSKTFWLAGNGGSLISKEQMLPFGWVLLEFNPAENAPFLPWFGEDNSWAEENRHANEHLKSKRKSYIEQRYREQQQKQAAELEQQQQAQRLAQLSPTQKAIHRLRQEYEQQRRFSSTDPQGHTRQLGSLLTETVELIANNGTAGDKAELFDLACELCRFWQVDRKKNKKMKQKLSVLQ